MDSIKLIIKFWAILFLLYHFIWNPMGIIDGMRQAIINPWHPLLLIGTFLISVVIVFGSDEIKRR